MKKEDGDELSKIPKSWMEKIAIVSGNEDFQHDVAQIASKAMLNEIAKEIPQYRWSYMEPNIVRNATTVSLMIQNIAIKDPKELKNLGQPTLRMALLWESVSRLKEKTDVNLALMNAAVCYQLAGFQANATCLARKISKDAEESNSLEFLSSLFLQRHFLSLRLHCEKLLEEPKDADEFQIMKKISLAAVSDAYLKITDYFLTGQKQPIKYAEEQFERAEKLCSELYQINEANLIRKIRSLIKLMVEQSTWNQLETVRSENLLWERYLKLLARGTGSDILSSSSISEIWPSQQHAIQSGLFDFKSNKIIKMPTSAGKTRIAELAIVSMLSKNPGAKCIYVAPYRALVAELENSFLNLFEDLGFSVSSIIGTYEQDPFEKKLAENADIVVITPEKLDLLLRAHPNILDDVKLFILDEGHIINDEKRGIKLEFLLTRLQRKLQDARFLLVSAVLPDSSLNEYIEWFNGEKKDVIKSEWRPSIQQHAKFEWSIKTESGTLRFESRKENKLLHSFVPGIITQRKFRIQNPQTGKMNTVRFPTNAKGTTAAELAYKFSEFGSVLIFTTQPSWVESIANSLKNRIDYSKMIEERLPTHFQHNSSRSYEIAKEWLGKEHSITELLKNGIAIHHGKLPDTLRRSIENDFREKRLRVIISTNTLAQGVNLPIKTIIMHSCRRRIDYNSKRISLNEYWNIAGRAGRAGQETEGTTIHIVNTPQDRIDYQYFLDNKQKLEPIKSALLNLLKELLADRISTSMLQEKIDSEVLALLVEEGGINGFIENLDEIIQNLLISYQLTDKSEVDFLSKNIKAVGKKISENVEKDDLEVFSSTGLSSTSCLSLKEFIETHASKIKEFIENPNTENNFEFITMIVSALSKVTEMEPTSNFDGNVSELLKKWISGNGINEIISEEYDQDKTKITKFIEEYFGILLPWGISSFIQIAQKFLKLEANDISNQIKYLSSCVKFGVPTFEASWCMMIGIPFRKVAIKLATKFISMCDEREYKKFMEWISDLDSETLNQEFGLTSPYLEDVSKTLFRTGKNPLLDDLSNFDTVLESSTWINGIKYENRDLAASKITQNSEIKIVRDYNNPFDRNAIRVLSNNKSELGYLNRNLAQLLAPNIDCGMNISAKAIEVQKGDITKIKIRLKKTQIMI